MQDIDLSEGESGWSVESEDVAWGLSAAKKATQGCPEQSPSWACDSPPLIRGAEKGMAMGFVH